VRQWAEWLYLWRLPALIIVALLTVFLGWEASKVDISTHFRDLYPASHPYVRLFDRFPTFGSPLTVSMVIRVRHGTIYNRRTIAKIQEATHLFDLIPGVDHDQIFSIASPSMTHVEATVSGIQTTFLMQAGVPQTAAEMAQLRHRIETTPGVSGTYVSNSGDAALIQATFVERLLNYGVIFDRVNAIVHKLQDKDHQVYAAGFPMLTGWVYHYRTQTYELFCLGFLAMVVLLAIYFRNLEGVLVPTVAGLASAVWGFGFAGVLGDNLDPLIIVVPILLVARALSHSVQMTERFLEIYQEVRDVREASIASLTSMFPPGLVGIMCDASGLFLIAIAPIGLIRKLAYMCGLWSLSLVVTAIIVTFLLVSYLPPAKNTADIVLSTKQRGGILLRVFKMIAACSSTKRRSATTALIFAVIGIVSAMAAAHRQMGDIHAGTSLLWPNSRYNRGVAEINHHFEGVNVFQVVMEGKGKHPLETYQALTLMRRFERYMRADPAVGGSFSFADMVPSVNRLYHSGQPKWNVVPVADVDAAMLCELSIAGAPTGEIEHWLRPGFTAAPISFWYRDHRGATIDRALARARSFIALHKAELKSNGLKMELASGSMGLRAANNEVIGRLEPVTVVLISLVIFVITAFVYRSVTAGLLLVLISNLAYLATAGVMYLAGIGLDVNTFPVAAVGMGIGIDYNIYLMSRMCEEYLANSNYAVLVPNSIFTTGKAIFFTATTMVIGVILWYFLSSLRFQADMGLLLSAVMLAHVALALFFQAAMMRILEPKFVATGSIIVKPRKAAAV
jgi:uncharacterized protein